MRSSATARATAELPTPAVRVGDGRASRSSSSAASSISSSPEARRRAGSRPAFIHRVTVEPCTPALAAASAALILHPPRLHPVAAMRACLRRAVLASHIGLERGQGGRRCRYRQLAGRGEIAGRKRPVAATGCNRALACGERVASKLGKRGTWRSARDRKGGPWSTCPAERHSSRAGGSTRRGGTLFLSAGSSAPRPHGPRRPPLPRRVEVRVGQLGAPS